MVLLFILGLLLALFGVLDAVSSLIHRRRARQVHRPPFEQSSHCQVRGR